MQATVRCGVVGLLAVILGSCAWQPTPSDHPHVLSKMADTDTPASNKPKCQSPGAACQPAMAGQRILLIRGLMDYVPGISPMTSLKARLANEGYDVTMITHMTDGFYKNQYWDAVIGHSQGAIDALRDAPDLARYNPHVTIIAVDPPRTSVLFHCEPAVRYLDLHTGEFGLGGGSLSCPQAQNLAMGGLHVTLPMRSDAQEQILAYLRQDAPIENAPIDALIEVADAEPTHVLAYAEPTRVSLPPTKPKLALPLIKPKPEPPKVVADDTFDARFTAVTRLFTFNDR
jgi:hypothetical protein